VFISAVSAPPGCGGSDGAVVAGCVTWATPGAAGGALVALNVAAFCDLVVTFVVAPLFEVAVVAVATIGAVVASTPAPPAGVLVVV
jgi:hypothetical protein